HQRVPRDPLPGRAVQIHLSLGPSHPHDQAWVYWTNDGSDPVGSEGAASNGFATALEAGSSEWDTLLWGYIRYFQGEIPPQDAGSVVRYRVSAGGSGEEIFADGGAYNAFYVDNDPPPTWAQDAIIYQIFADRFFSSAPDFPIVEGKPSLKANGTLRGMIEKLDHIVSLGANCLWLTPIFPSPTYHGYDATSFFEINPRLGTKEDFRELVDQAHARSIRILMDFVPNHWSNQHLTFLEATQDRESPYFNWYTFEDWPHRYKCFFTSRSMPQINLRYGPARQHVLDSAKYWLDFGVDGYRVDYCIGPTPDFYADFRRVTRTSRPDSWTFGEAVDPPDSQLTFEGGMDGALDFMLLEAIRKTFAFRTWDARQFADFLERHEAYFPDTFSRPSFLDNHDMNRFLWVAGGDIRRLKLAALCQFTLVGPPVIYYGTEVGLSQQDDVMQHGRAIHEEARLPMLWGEDQDKDLLAFYKDLIKLRASKTALRRGTRQTIFSDGNVLAYRRANGKQSLITVLNLLEQEMTVELELTEAGSVFAISPDCKIQEAGGKKRITLPGLGGVVIE
ncbi:MAG TPA: alpha-amylase family glycosyl hydrolase, partial [Anaerolineales bacterium]|nr:alpha-amylase family glycosyl hydrolase [Anaerolineales bacterium]